MHLYNRRLSIHYQLYHPWSFPSFQRQYSSILQTLCIPSNHHLILTNIHALGLQILPGLRYLALQLRIRIGNIVEREDTPAKLEEKVCAEGNKCPEGNLLNSQFGQRTLGLLNSTYVWNDFLLDLLGERNDLHEYRKVQLRVC
jgi:hypothetical protein